MQASASEHVFVWIYIYICVCVSDKCLISVAEIMQGREYAASEIDLTRVGAVRKRWSLSSSHTKMKGVCRGENELILRKKRNDSNYREHYRERTRQGCTYTAVTRAPERHNTAQYQRQWAVHSA